MFKIFNHRAQLQELFDEILAFAHELRESPDWTVHLAMGPPAADAEIAAAEKSRGKLFPEPLKELLKIANGFYVCFIPREYTAHSAAIVDRMPVTSRMGLPDCSYYIRSGDGQGHYWFDFQELKEDAPERNLVWINSPFDGHEAGFVYQDKPPRNPTIHYINEDGFHPGNLTLTKYLRLLWAEIKSHAEIPREQLSGIRASWRAHERIKSLMHTCEITAIDEKTGQERGDYLEQAHPEQTQSLSLHWDGTNDFEILSEFPNIQKLTIGNLAGEIDLSFIEPLPHLESLTLEFKVFEEWDKFAATTRLSMAPKLRLNQIQELELNHPWELTDWEFLRSLPELRKLYVENMHACTPPEELPFLTRLTHVSLSDVEDF